MHIDSLDVNLPEEPLHLLDASPTQVIGNKDSLALLTKSDE